MIPLRFLRRLVASCSLCVSASFAGPDSVVTFNELHYHPASGQSGGEWVELHNQNSVDIDLSGWRLDDGIDYLFPRGTVLRGGKYLVIAADPAALMAATGLTGVLGPFANQLANEGEHVALKNHNGRMMDEITYTDRQPWPVAADGSGATLAKVDELHESFTPGNWRASLEWGGTPGDFNMTAPGYGVPDSPTTSLAGTRRYFPFEGSVVDASANNLMGSLNGGVGFAADHPAGLASTQSLDCDGVNDSATVVDPFLSTAYTLSVWVKPKAIRAQNLVARLDSAGAQISHQLRMTAAGVFEHATLATSLRVVTGTTVAAAERWYHLTAVATNSGQSRLYVDGVEEGTAQTVTTLSGTSDRWTFGGTAGTNTFFDGKLDEVAIWHVGLDAASVAALAAGTLAPGDLAPRNLAAQKPVIDGTGSFPNNAFDASGGPGLDFTAGRVTDGSQSDVAGTNYWLGRTGKLLESFTLDLGSPVDIKQIHLRNTHNDADNNAGTASFRIFAATEVDAAKQLVAPTQILAGILPNLAGRSLLPANTYTGANGLTLTTSRFLRFEAVTASTLEKTVGLNEIEVYGAFSAGASLSPPLPLERPQAIPIAINEVSSVQATAFWLELLNYGPQPVSLEGCILALGSGPQFTFPAQILEPGGFLMVPQSQLGFRPIDGDTLFLYTAGRKSIIGGVVGKNRHQARPPGQPTADFQYPHDPADHTPGAPNRLTLEDAVVINEIMYHHSPTYAKRGNLGQSSTTVLVPPTAEWKYHKQGVSLGTAWRASDYDDSGWSVGAAPFGFETEGSVLPEPFGTDFLQTDGQWTYYFRKSFTYTAGPQPKISIKLRIDDGCAVYINGTEILPRQNLPTTGPILYDTPALTGVEATAYVTVPVPDGTLIPGQVNTIAVEVHQNANTSSDAVFGFQLLETVSLGGEAPTPFVENPEEWVELYNRSPRTVDLAGWQLDGGVGFTFPLGAQLAPGAYLVVTREVVAFQAAHPGVPAAGPFSGHLSHRGELLQLKDAMGSVVDEVFYRDSKPWPGFAGAGGCSLELRNPDADNSVPEAWASSDESSRSTWQNYSFTARAIQPVYSPGIFSFHEFRLALLEEGQVLIDDVSVLEDPSGTNRELLQNGAFSAGTAAAWRLLGNHEASQVVTDNANPCLKLVAEGPMLYMHNLLETTLKSGTSFVPVVRDREYRISFRAKWLRGCPQVHTELYYNKWARTFLLAQPAESGTPGARNSVYQPNVGPTFHEVRHTPVVPKTGQIITVSAAVSDPDAVGSVNLRYRIDPAATFQSVPMSLGGDGRHAGQIPAQSTTGAIIQFYLEATDAAAAPATELWPLAGPNSRALIKINDNKAPANRQTLRVIMTAADVTKLFSTTEEMSNRLRGCTLIHNEQEVFYDGALRQRGSMFSRGDDASGHSIHFPSDHLFRGVQETISCRRQGMIEIVAKHTINVAGGLPDNYNDVIFFVGERSNTNASAVGPSRMEMARFSNSYLDEEFPDGSQGTQFKMEGIREPQSTNNGTPEGIKLGMPVGWVSTFDLANLGDDPEQYRHNLRFMNNFSKDDNAQLIRMCKALSLTGAALQAAVAGVMDVDEWMRHFALLSLMGIGDAYSQGNPHNINFYVPPGPDGKIIAIPWDWNFTFSNGSSAPLWGNQNIAKVIQLPIYKRLFLGHMRDMIRTIYNANYLTPWLQHLGSLTGESYTGNSSYVTARNTFVLNQINTQIPPVAFAITTNNGDDFSVDGPRVELAGSGWIDVREIRLNDFAEPLQVSWTAVKAWEVTVPLHPGVNTIVLGAYDHQGREVGADTIHITNTSLLEPASKDNLVVSEIHYHPATTENDEFIEVMNIASRTIDLTGCQFSDGIEYTFPAGGRLAPGERLVIPKAQFLNATSLANGGEHLLLIGTGGAEIRSFSYDDAPPWPTTADGAGPSLVLIAPRTNPDHTDPGSWRSSFVAGGNAGISDSTAFVGNPAADVDGDGLTAFLEHALGTSDAIPNDPAGGLQVGSVSPDTVNAGGFLVTLHRNLAADDAALTLDLSTNLQAWSTAATEFVSREHTGSQATEVWRVHPPAGSPGAVWLRLKVAAP